MVNILFFAGVKESTGVERLEIEYVNQTIADLKTYLQDRYPTLSLDGVMVAINEEFAFDEDVISDHDTVAFIPPVSGG
ncbi:molybdopterin converting factor subunit 1 [Bacillus sp. B1-b2]|uniref:molybdopterin converting factor subunit 1 n=1 Tax=Bacillus sp. B1-b2 TaxID=2653201 RepID=UPI001261A3B3|nr:molybdopterin converting factor subunit 1 [Bacillus sp. B1-b2]KAB7670635.1 molybdopterin converting factor subunit 1 [Bacillus sp. B1-b2]